MFFSLASKIQIVESGQAFSKSFDLGLTLSSRRLYTIIWAILAEYSFQLLALKFLPPLFSPLASELSIVENSMESIL